MEISLKSGNVSAKLNSHGAELRSLMIGGRELMWNADPKYWAKTSPILFPMVGALKDGKTLILGKEYKLPKHGFTRDLELTAETVSSTSALFSLEQSDYTKEFYPFDFRFTVRYTLKTDGITVTYRVKNNSADEMPFCIGAHPAFAFDGEFSDHRLEFPKPETAAVPFFETPAGIFHPNDRRTIIENSTVLQLNHEMFYGDVLYFDKPNSRSVMFLDKGNKGVRVDYPDFTGIGFWQAKDAPFLCLEPWCGSADFVDCTGVFAEKPGIEILKPDEERAFTYSISAVGY